MPVYSQVILRSDDDGRSWRVKERCCADPRATRSELQGYADISELGMAETGNGEVIGLGRPEQEALMAMIRSRDGGRSWRFAGRAPFPGYCVSLTRTTSGALVAITRFPYLCAHVSYNGGRTRDIGTILDFPMWANQRAIEVEPNVILVLYMGHVLQKGIPDVRALRIRVLRDGLTLATRPTGAGELSLSLT